MLRLRRRQTRQTRRVQIRIPSVKEIRQGAVSFFRGAKTTGKKVVESLRRLTRRMTCRKR